MSATTEVPMPAIEDVKPLEGNRVRVAWSDGPRAGKTEVVDLTPLIDSFKLYRPLRHNDELLRSVHVAEDGNAIAWGDDELDMSATSIERLAEEAMTADEFRGFLKAHRLTHGAAAAILGRSRRQVENYLAGEPIPRVVVLACFGYEARSRAEAQIPSASSV